MFYTCPHCGAHLDSIDEKCDCGEEQGTNDPEANLPKQDDIAQYYREWYAD